MRANKLNDNGLAFIKKFITENAITGKPNPDTIPRDDTLPGPFIIRGIEIVPSKDWTYSQKREYQACKRRANWLRDHPIVSSEKPIRIQDTDKRHLRTNILRNVNSSLYMN